MSVVWPKKIMSTQSVYVHVDTILVASWYDIEWDFAVFMVVAIDIMYKWVA